jgi:flagellar assembly protein FliH
MSSTSRVLRADELSVVTPMWWRDTAPAATPAAPEASQPQKAKPAPAARQDPAPSADRERIEREAYQRGFAEGKALGKDQAAAEIQPVLDRLGRALADLSSLRSQVRRDAEKDLLKLSIAIARRVLHRELTLDPESIEGLIKVALEKLQSRDLCRVRVHPDQEAAIRASLERFTNSNKVELIADASLQSGDVLFETAHGDIDASIEAQLREIERGFADRLRR